MKNRVPYSEISDLFESNTYYIDKTELFWYRYMWSVLEKQTLTQYADDAEYYAVYFRAVALVYIFYGFVSAIDDVDAYPDCVYENCLSDIIPAFILGQLFAGKSDEIETDESYAIFVLAQKEYNKIREAILSEMSFEQLLQTLQAVSYHETRFSENADGDEIEEDWSPKAYEDYLELVTKRISDIDIGVGCNPHAAYDWVVNNEAYFDFYQ